MKEEIISKESIVTKIEGLKKDRDNFLTQANSQIAAFNGAISVLEDILNPEKNIENPLEKENA
jgi:hypothetical protein